MRHGPVTKRWIVPVNRLLAMMLASYCAMTTGCFIVASHPSDSELAELLNEQQEIIERLRSLVVSDTSAVCIGPDFAHEYTPQGNIEIIHGKDGWEEHRKIMRRLGMSGSVCQLVGTEDVVFTISSVGFLFSGSTKGLAYLEQPPQTVLSSLDVLEADLPGPGRYFRHVQDHWYIYFSR